VAIITAVTAGVMSWMEFSNVSKKLGRYNFSVGTMIIIIIEHNHLAL